MTRISPSKVVDLSNKNTVKFIFNYFHCLMLVVILSFWLLYRPTCDNCTLFLVFHNTPLVTK